MPPSPTSPSFVLDNSVVMSWCFGDEANTYADAVLNALSDATALVPTIWPLEVINVLLVAERRKRINPSDSVHFLTLLSQLPIVVEHEWPQRMMRDLLTLGREANLSAYDVAYMDLAMRKNCPLASMDRQLIDAAGKMNIPIYGEQS